MNTPAQIGQQFKQKYPGAYDQYPDDVVGQKALIAHPEHEDAGCKTKSIPTSCEKLCYRTLKLMRS